MPILYTLSTIHPILSHFHRSLLTMFLISIFMLNVVHSNERLSINAPPTFPECSASLNAIDLESCESERLNMMTELLDTTYHSTISLLDQGHHTYETKYQNAYYDNFEMPYLHVKDELIKAQVLWQQYIRSDCAMIFEMGQRGEAKEILKLECLQDHTQKRLKALQDYQREIELDINAFLNMPANSATNQTS